jgi:hypothetical protein
MATISETTQPARDGGPALSYGAAHRRCRDVLIVGY